MPGYAAKLVPVVVATKLSAFGAVISPAFIPKVKALDFAYLQMFVPMEMRLKSGTTLPPKKLPWLFFRKLSMHCCFGVFCGCPLFAVVDPPSLPDEPGELISGWGEPLHAIARYGIW